MTLCPSCIGSKHGRHKVATDGFDGRKQPDPKDWVRDSLRPLGWHVLRMCGQGWWVSGTKLWLPQDQDHQNLHLGSCDERLEGQLPSPGWQVGWIEYVKKLRHEEGNQNG